MLSNPCPIKGEQWVELGDLACDYLSLIANSETVQPLCRMVTRTHWKDELAHANVFNFIATLLFKPFNRNLIP